MRLLHAQTLKFQDFDESELPQYVILSHTWSAGEEVSIQDMSSPYLPKKIGYDKVLKTCESAFRCGIHYAWIDTCCIDKTSSAELTESINSMFRWYQKAAVCFVYLDDLAPATSMEEGLSACRWFSRGWTLQELLAPSNVQFYDQAWIYRGTKQQFSSQINTITGIPEVAINDPDSVKGYSVAQRMAWAALRKTTRIEDRAYCLLGLFDVNMPLIYGEGLQAFRRLQEEIIKLGVDLTLFAWRPSAEQLAQGAYSLLATSPAEFSGCHYIEPYEGESISGYLLTNKGLQLTTYLIRVPMETPGPYVDDVSRYVLRLGRYAIDNTVFDVGIYVKKASPCLLMRETNPVLAVFPHRDREFHRSTRTYKLCFLTTPSAMGYRGSSIARASPVAFHFPVNGIVKVRAESEIPAGSWDHRRRICFRPSSTKTIVAFSFLASIRGLTLNFGVLFDFRGCYGTDTPRCLVLDKIHTESRLLFLILQRNLNESMEWRNVRDELPGIKSFSNRLVIKEADRSFEIVVFITPSVNMNDHQEEINCPVLRVEIMEVPRSTAISSSWEPPQEPPLEQIGGDDWLFCVKIDSEDTVLTGFMLFYAGLVVFYELFALDTICATCIHIFKEHAVEDGRYLR